MKTCSACPVYSKALGRCKEEKIVPKTIQEGKDAVKLMGASYICPKTPGYQKIVFRSIWEVPVEPTSGPSGPRDTSYNPDDGQIDYSGKDANKNALRSNWTETGWNECYDDRECPAEKKNKK